MKRTLTYRQCKLRKGSTHRVGWIPISFAKINHIVRLKINNRWTNGWRVMEVGSVMSGEYVEKHESDYRTQREASDI